MQDRCRIGDQAGVYRQCTDTQEQQVVHTIISTLIPELMNLTETYENSNNSIYVLETLSQYLRIRIQESTYADQRFIYELMHFYTNVVIDS